MDPLMIYRVGQIRHKEIVEWSQQPVPPNRLMRVVRGFASSLRRQTKRTHEEARLSHWQEAKSER